MQPDRTAYPFAAHYLPLEAGRMHYVDEGTGEPVLMVHGNPTWSFLYRHVIRVLAPHHRCVAPDLLGFGLSDKPPGWSYRAEAHAEHLEALVAALGLRDLTLVVHDWGGPVGLRYALRHPENVRRLVILNTWMWPVDDTLRFVLFSRLAGGPLGRFLIRQFNVFTRFGMPMLFGGRRRLTPEAHRHYVEALARPEERKGCWTLVAEILGATPWLRALWADRRRLADKPALIAWGTKDAAFQEPELARWETLLPQARVHRLDDVGHFVPEEAGVRLGKLIAAFLAEPG